MKITFAVPVILALTALALPAHAQGLRAVQPVPGYACAKLNATDAQMMNPAGSGIVIRPAPRPDALPSVEAPAVLFVKQPAMVVSGFMEVLQLNGKPGWIAARFVKPVDPLTRCTPSVMSDGKLGIG